MATSSALRDLTPSGANDNESMAAFLLTMRGQTAALAGMSVSTNPYRPDSFEGSRWAAGWIAGMMAIGDADAAGRKTAPRPQKSQLRMIGTKSAAPLGRSRT